MFVSPILHSSIFSINHSSEHTLWNKTTTENSEILFEILGVIALKTYTLYTWDKRSRQTHLAWKQNESLWLFSATCVHEQSSQYSNVWYNSKFPALSYNIQSYARTLISVIWWEALERVERCSIGFHFIVMIGFTFGTYDALYIF